jgi:hypothetical protein
MGLEDHRHHRTGATSVDDIISKLLHDWAMLCEPQELSALHDSRIKKGSLELH